MSFARTFAGAIASTFIAAGAAVLIVGCGSISIVSDGGSGAGGNIDVTTGSGGTTTAAGGHTGAGGATGVGGQVGGTGGATGQGGARAGTGGTIAGTGGAGVGGMSGTGGAPATGGSTGTIDAGVDGGPCICPDIVMPVCGADGHTYGNSCLAGCAGVTVAHQGACVDAGVACMAVRGCCSMDSDCNRNEECAGVTCGADGRASGVCKARPAGNRCWTDADCAGQNNNNCTGAVVCPCGTICLRADTLGMCN